MFNSFQFMENCGRLECLSVCPYRQMKMNTVLKCICLILLKPWKGTRANYFFYKNDHYVH